MVTQQEVFHINNKIFKLFMEEEEILRIVVTLAQRINKDYRDKNPLFLIVLKGSVFFGTDLLRNIIIDCDIDFISSKSYGNSMDSSGNVLINIDHLDLDNRNVIIVEDIIDTGYTLKAIMDTLSKFKEIGIETVALLSKPEKREVEVNIKYIGKEIPPDFVIGYGLDYAEKGRNLRNIYILEK